MPGTLSFLPSGRGELTRESFAVTGAGSQWFVQIPTNEVWQLIALHYRLTTSATAATRHVRMHFEPASLGTLNPTLPCGYTQVASTTVEGYFLAQSPRNDVATVAITGGALVGVTGMGEWWVWDGLLRLTALLLQAGDNFSLVEATYNQWRY